MPIQINARPQAGFDNPLGLLSDCHRRIERFLGQLRTLAELPAGALNEDESAIAENALRYFTEAAPRHTRDEEDSLFPRLRSVAEGDDPSRAAQARSALQAVARLEEDHGRAEAGHIAVDALFRCWITDGHLPERERERLCGLLADLSECYRGHTAVEDSHVFPLAALALDDEQRREVGQEMASRRGLNADRLRAISHSLLR
jgi:hemerythrin-like domain-containing protein